jgi:predicted anti-sigma-YlaC factor YlaD
MSARSASRSLVVTGCALAVLLLSSCSINQFAVRTVAGFLSGSGQSTVFTGEDDPELVRDALPFVLKTYESLLEADPQNAPLALATGRTFVSYAFAFIQAPSDELPSSKADEQRAMRDRAKRLFLRARAYILRGLEIRRPGFGAAFEKGNMDAALKLTRPEDADYLYWAGAAWMAAFSADPFDFAQIITLPRAVALLKQVDGWDGAYGAGAVHEIFITFYGAAPAELGGSEAKARESFDRVMKLSKGQRAGPYLALATAVSIKRQDVQEFSDLLGKALAVDLDASPGDRLVNIINQRKARWLLDHVEDYFLPAEGGS